MNIRAALLVLLLLPAAGLQAATPEDLIRSIFAAHQPWASKSIDFYDNLSGLTKYFDDSLIELIRKDNESSKAGGGVGCLDFDPLLDAQDFDETGITTPKIQKLSATRYEVTFTGRSKAWKDWNERLVFDMVQTKTGWRVHDITYKSGNSLTKILKCDEK